MKRSLFTFIFLFPVLVFSELTLDIRADKQTTLAPGDLFEAKVLLYPREEKHPEELALLKGMRLAGLYIIDVVGLKLNENNSDVIEGRIQFVYLGQDVTQYQEGLPEPEFRPEINVDKSSFTDEQVQLPEKFFIVDGQYSEQSWWKLMLIIVLSIVTVVAVSFVLIKKLRPL